MLKRLMHLALVGIFTFLFAIPAQTIHAQDPAPKEIWVNSTLDLDDNAQNSVCSGGTPVGGPCTLRAALFEANWCTLDPVECEGGVIIHVPSGTYTLTIPPNTAVAPGSKDDIHSGDLDIFPQFALPVFIIEGDLVNPPVINANSLDRVFHIANTSVPVTLRYLTVRGGRTEISELSGSAYKEGAGVLNNGILELESLTVENNQIICLPGATQCSGGTGGGVFNNNQLLINNSTLRNNLAGRGGGLFTAGSQQVRIFNTTISGNETVYAGGGIASYSTLFTMQNSTVSDNSAGFTGGVGNYGTMKLYNVTIAGNNSADSSAANLVNTASLTIRNSIVAYPRGPQSTPNCQNTGTWTTEGANLYSDATCPTGTGVISSTDPKLTPLAWLGGSTLTRGLRVGSPAHNVGTNFCLDAGGFAITTDQRGFNRDNKCDLGAYEGAAYMLNLPAIRR